MPISPLSLRRPVRLAAMAVAVALLLNSCAVVPAASPEPDAKAPMLDGYGRNTLVPAVVQPEARRLFDAGVLQAYAFNEGEAVRMFKAALARDPACVLCAWGVAWQLGPNINDSRREGVKEALKYLDHAMHRLGHATDRERALVEALALRYAHASQARETAPLLGERCGKAAEPGAPNPLDVAYAERLRGLADRYPQDPDILSLYAEAEMIATPGDSGWTEAGTPVGRIGEVADRIARLLTTQTEHAGLNHYMVHSVDDKSVAARGLAAADRLARIAPASSHLLHMPAHLYVWTNRFDDAVRVNQEALAADTRMAAILDQQGFKPTKDWRGHNGHFLWYAAIMNGRQDVALDAAAQVAASLGDRNNPFAEYVQSLPMITLVRFENWAAALDRPRPADGVGIAQAFWEHGRGVAYVRTGRKAEAQATLEALRATVARVRGDDPAKVPKRRLAMVDYALARLEAEVKLAAGDAEGALASQAAAVAAAAPIDRLEPPWLAESALLSLGEMQLKARRRDAAEATFQQSLADRPGNVWAIKGLAQTRAGRS